VFLATWLRPLSKVRGIVAKWLNHSLLPWHREWQHDSLQSWGRWFVNLRLHNKTCVRIVAEIGLRSLSDLVMLGVRIKTGSPGSRLSILSTKPLVPGNCGWWSDFIFSSRYHGKVWNGLMGTHCVLPWISTRRYRCRAATIFPLISRIGRREAISLAHISYPINLSPCSLEMDESTLGHQDPEWVFGLSVDPYVEASVRPSTSDIGQ